MQIKLKKTSDTNKSNYSVLLIKLFCLFALETETNGNSQ